MQRHVPRLVDHSRVARGSLVGRRVARGSLILAPVREKRGSRGDPLLNIYYYTLLAGGLRPAPTHAGVPKKSVLGVYGGKGGFEILIPQTEKLSVRHSGNSGCSPSAKTAFGKTVATTNDGEQRKTTTTDDD